MDWNMTNMINWNMTNMMYWSAATNIFEDQIEYMVKQGTFTNFVERIIKEGHVCNIIGHNWASGCGVPGCLVFHTGQLRHCLICGKVETAETVWK
jgi:hypothetical protein